MAKIKNEEKTWEEQIDQMAKDRQEKRNRENALNWMRTLLFPFIEEQAETQGLTIRQAADKIVADGTRIDMVLRENWDNSELRRLLDSGPARMVMASSGGLLNETDAKTAEGARWLLDKVLGEDPEGADIRDAFLKDPQSQELWVSTIVGIKRLFASRIIRPRPAPTRSF